jgi:hypothetical protein
MDDQRTPPPTATELLRLVEAEIISRDEARTFLFGNDTEKTTIRLINNGSKHARSSSDKFGFVVSDD